MVLLFIFIAPLLAAYLSFFVAGNISALGFAAIISTAVQLITSATIAARIDVANSYEFTHYFSVDHLGAILLLLLSFGGLMASLYARGYLESEISKGIIGFTRAKKLFAQLHLFLLAMSLAITTTNPIFMWISIEATTLTTAFLISFYNKPSAIEAAWKYLMLNSVGLLLAFFGTLLYLTSGLNSAEHGIVTWQSLLFMSADYNPFIIKMAFLFTLIGYGTKVGLVPMHTWLPDAHSKAPSPISSLLSGVLLNIPLFAILRFKTITDAAVGSDFSSRLLVGFGILSLVVSAAIILVQKNYKRLLAYSSIKHMGIITFGFGIGGAASTAALLHMIYHSLTKSMLFFSAGTILLKYSSTKIARVRGLLSTLPVTSIVFFIGILAIIGIPPWGIFFTEFSILSAGIQYNLPITIIALAAIILAGIGFIRHLAAIEFGLADEHVHPGELSGWTVAPILILVSILTLLSVLMPQNMIAFITTAVSHL